jgi:hypothetical protein
MSNEAEWYTNSNASESEDCHLSDLDSLLNTDRYNDGGSEHTLNVFYAQPPTFISKNLQN